MHSTNLNMTAMNKSVKIIAAALMATVFVPSVSCQKLTVNETTGKYREEHAIKVDSVKKDTLFKRTYKWLYTRFPNTGDKGTYINADKGKIVAHEYFNPDARSLADYTNLRIGYVMTCEFSDNKVKYNYTDFYYFSTGEGKVNFESEKFQKNDVQIRDVMLKTAYDHVTNMASELTAYLQKLKKTTPPKKK